MLIIIFKYFLIKLMLWILLIPNLHIYLVNLHIYLVCDKSDKQVILTHVVAISCKAYHKIRKIQQSETGQVIEKRKKVHTMKQFSKHKTRKYPAC